VSIHEEPCIATDLSTANEKGRDL